MFTHQNSRNALSLNGTDLGAQPAAPRLPRRRLGSARLAFALACAAAAPSGAGCSSNNLTPGVNLIDQTTKALGLGTANALNGTYGTGCIHHEGGGDTWSTPIGSFDVGSLENSPLQVVQGNGACVLTLTSVLFDSTKYDPPSPVDLTGSFLMSALAYKADGAMGGDPVSFYGNAMLSDASFASAFSISMKYSNDKAFAGPSTTGSYKFNSFSASQNLVAAPNYTPTSSVMVQTDATQTITDVSGSIDLTNALISPVTGEHYVISTVHLTSSSTYADIDAAYTGTVHAITGADPSVAASALGLTGADLSSTLYRDVIVAHTVNGINSYQVVALSLLPPS